MFLERNRFSCRPTNSHQRRQEWRYLWPVNFPKVDKHIQEDYRQQIAVSIEDQTCKIYNRLNRQSAIEIEGRSNLPKVERAFQRQFLDKVALPVQVSMMTLPKLSQLGWFFSKWLCKRTVQEKEGNTLGSTYQSTSSHCRSLRGTQVRNLVARLHLQEK